MSQTGKASGKRSKPSYFMSIIGVTLVLFLLGIIGWLVIVANKVGSNFKENVEVNVYLRGELNPKDSVYLMNYISEKPYVKDISYTTKDMAKKKFLEETDGEGWDDIIEFNPLPASIDFRLKEDYVHPDSLTAIKADLEKQTYVNEVAYQEALVDSLTKNVRRISIALMVLAIGLTIIVIVLIDNTIKLSMFSNRFLIKTMQMVGATRYFIAKPMNVRAIINGAFSGLIAAGLVWLLVYAIEKYVLPEGTASVLNDKYMYLLFLSLIVLGVVITLVSTHRSVIKYLKMKLDDLY